MLLNFINIRILDILDILLVALLMYQLYLLIRGTVAMNIFIGILVLLVVWGIVYLLKMELLGSILSNLFSVGVIALIILFQQELRRFLILLGTRYFPNKNFSFDSLLNLAVDQTNRIKFRSIYKACINMSEKKIGALIVIKRKSALDIYAQSGTILNAETSSRLLESIFFKNSPLHDGAVIIEKNLVYSASSVLPVSDNVNLSPDMGLRHRAAVGLTENTDALVIIVSEETGKVSISENGRIVSNITPQKLLQVLESEASRQ
jgi:diadenylate cyclase